MPPLCAKKSHNRYHYVKYVLQKKLKEPAKYLELYQYSKHVHEQKLH